MLPYVLTFSHHIYYELRYGCVTSVLPMRYYTHYHSAHKIYDEFHIGIKRITTSFIKNLAICFNKKYGNEW